MDRFDTFLLFQILSSFVYAVGFRIGWSWVMSFVVIVCHEMALGLGLGKWIVDEGPRSDLISANRYILTSGWESLRSQILLGRGEGVQDG